MAGIEILKGNRHSRRAQEALVRKVMKRIKRVQNPHYDPKAVHPADHDPRV